MATHKNIPQRQPEYARITLRIPKSVDRAMEHAATDIGMTKQAIVEAALREFLRIREVA